jgi:hypothetical protein
MKMNQRLKTTPYKRKNPRSMQGFPTQFFGTRIRAKKWSGHSRVRSPTRTMAYLVALQELAFYGFGQSEN